MPQTHDFESVVGHRHFLLAHPLRDDVPESGHRAGTPSVAWHRGAGPHPVATVHYSDRGSQYASDTYQTALNQNQLGCLMTDGYDCYLNALAKRVNDIMKDELLVILPDDGAQTQLLVD